MRSTMRVSPKAMSQAATAVMAACGLGAFLLVIYALRPPAVVDAAAVDEEPPATVAYLDEDLIALGEPALADFPYPWRERLPGWTIEFVRGDSEIAGYTWSHEARIEVFVRPSSSSESLRRVLAHEIGHAIDVTLNDGDDRRRWQEARGLGESPWWPVSGAADFETGAGDFAESFAFWVMGDSADFRSLIGDVPSESDLALLAELADAEE